MKNPILKYCLLFAVGCLAALALPGPGRAQGLPLGDSIWKDTSKAAKDTTSKDSTATKRKKMSGIDSVVTYSAKDSVHFNLPSKKIRLRGSAKMDYKTQSLTAEIIEMELENSLLRSEGARDSAGHTYGSPQFTDNKDVFFGSKIKYNFRTSQGSIDMGETKLEDGYYFGQSISRVSESELFVKNGCYTTCSDPHPHYYFGSPEMKVVAQDRVLLDPLVLYVEDMPVFIVPFGLYFPTKGGRQSGIIIPSFFFSKSRGVTFENLGLYLALSDYYDTKITADLYTKGGFTLKNYWQWKLLNKFYGNLEASFGKTRTNVDDDYTKNWSLRLNHNQQITPQSSFVANINFSSQDYNRNTTWDINSRVQQTMSSNASYSTSFDNGSNLSVSYRRTQNIITNAYNQSASTSYSLPSWKPFKKALSSKNWLGDLTVSYSGAADWSEDKSVTYKQIYSPDTTIDTISHIAAQRRISHRPSISVSPKLGYFTITPSVSFSANNYFRRLTRTMNEDSTISDEYETGMFTEYNYNFGVSVSTRLFGIMKPNILGVKAFRHTFEPTVSYSYTPDLSASKYGFYESYFDRKQNRNITYSRFESDGGGLASRNKSQNISYGINNSFEAKVADRDTLPDKNLVLLRFNISGAYNFMADSLGFSDISTTFRTMDIGKFSMNGSAGFTIYDEDFDFDKNGKPTGSTHRVSRLYSTTGNGLVRLTRFNLNISTSFSSEGQSATTADAAAKHQSDSLELGERFRQRIDYTPEERDFFGENMPGSTPVNLPWTLTASLTYSLIRTYKNQDDWQLGTNLSGTLRLTDTWNITASAMYDFVNKQLSNTSIGLTKDLHCWQLQFTWQPTGYSSGFYLKFGIRAPQLQDLKIEKRNTPFYR